MTAGLIEVPTDVWLDMRMLPVLPRFVHLPLFPPDAYGLEHVVKDPSLDRLLPYATHAVRLATESRVDPTCDGALVIDGDAIHVCMLRHGQKSVVRVTSKITSIGRLVKRDTTIVHTPQLDSWTILREIQHRAAIVHVDGVHVDFELSLDPKPRRPGIASATDVLQLLVRSIEDRNRWGFVGDSPIARALRDEDRRLRGHGLDALYARTAHQFIASYELGVPEPIEVPDLTLAPEQLRALYERRVLATLRVTVTDPRWTQHLADAPEWMHVEDRTLPKPR